MYLRTIDAPDAAKLIAIVVALGFVAIGGRRALVRAQAEAPGVLAGVRLSLGGFVASCLTAGLNAFIYYSETDCRSVPAGVSLSWMCDLVRVSWFAFAAAALIHLAGLFAWPPWREPLRLQIVRGVLGVAWLLAGYSFLLTGIR